MEDRQASVRGEVVQGIALVTFYTRERNVASVESWARLTEMLDVYAADDAVRVLVLTGAGHHVFVGDPPATDAPAQAEYDAAAARAQGALAAFPKPAIARVRGDCIGNGLLLASNADLLVAAEDSTFALPAARWGLAYSPQSVATLVRLVGPQHAKRLLFVGGRMNAREALRIGLVTLVVDDADLSDIVVDLARAIADNAPLAVAAAKRLVEAPEDGGLAGLVDSCRASADYDAGVAALRRGKLPAFTGT